MLFFFFLQPSINNHGESIMFAFKLIIIFLMITTFLAFTKAYSATATDNPNDRCPDKRCCYPVKGNEYPPCAIVDGWGCATTINVDCIGVWQTVLVTVQVSDYPYCEIGYPGYNQCYILSWHRDCYDAYNFELELYKAQIEASSKCQNVIVDISK